MSYTPELLYRPAYAKKAHSLGTALLFVALLTICAASPRTWASDQKDRTAFPDFLKQLRYESVAFNHDRGNRPLVKGELAGKQHVFLVDTGWKITTLQPQIAAGLKTLGELGVVLDDSLLGAVTNSSIVLMEKLTLGKAQFLNQPALVGKLDMDFVRVPFDGVLGCDFLTRNFCLIDFNSKRLYVRGGKPSADESKALEKSLRDNRFVEVPLHGRSVLIIDAQINSQPVQLLLDSGSSVSVVDQAQLELLGLATIKKERTGSLIPADINSLLIGVEGIGAHKLRVTKLSTLQLGVEQWKSIYFGVVDLEALSIREANGVLGSDMLATYGALIDFSSHKMWLRPQEQAPPGPRDVKRGA